MRTRKLQAITFAGAFALVVSFQSQATEPVRLSESQLDEVTAGFLAVSMAAEAIAQSQVADTLTDTLTLTNVTVGQPQVDGYIYSTGDGLAIATAIGEQIHTSTSGGFETDEQIVSFKVLHSITTETVKQVAPEPKTNQRQARKDRQAAKRQNRQEKQKAGKRQNRQEKQKAGKRQTRQEKQKVAKRQNRQEKQKVAKRQNRQEKQKAAKRQTRQEKQRTEKRHNRQEKQRAAKRQTRQEKQRAAKRQTRQEKQRAAKRQVKREARIRAKSAAPVFKQTQVLQLQVVTRRPATALPF